LDKNLPMLTITYITGHDDLLKAAFLIRQKVFVEEQNVPAAEEYDEYETTSRHFLAFYNGIPCGTARWRYTDKGIKLERFAVLADFRSQKVGSALVQAVLEDVQQQADTAGKLLYLHAQVTAMPLYAKFGFEPLGDRFLECDIEHYKMIRLPASMA